MVFACEAWAVASDGGDLEELCESKEFADEEIAKNWLWDRVQEGYAILMWRR